MIAIDVEFLTWRYIAARFDDRQAPEWPPHPARLFSALVATASEMDDAVADVGRRALEWLEQQGAPHVLASDAEPRARITVYVPGNTNRVIGDWSKAEAVLAETEEQLRESELVGDSPTTTRARRAVERARQSLDATIQRAIVDPVSSTTSACSEARGMLPEHRGRQPRSLPSVTPHEPRVRFLWPDASPDEPTREALSGLLQYVVRLGHSSSFVACRIADGPCATDTPGGLHTWVPAETGDDRLRTVAPGQLARLEQAHARHRGTNPRTLAAHHQAYRRRDTPPAAAPALSCLGEWLVLKEIAPETGRRLGLRLTRTEDLTRGLRDSLLRHAEDPPPAVLLGRNADGSPLTAHHVAFVALADVGSSYASGAVLGAAMLLPRDIRPDDRRSVLRALGLWEQSGLRLELHRGGTLHFERIVDLDPRRTLDPSTWTRPSRRWASVTPIALDQNPGPVTARDPAAAAQAAERAEQIIARACEHIGLPRPAWVQVMRRSLFDACPPAKAFAPYPRNGPGIQRVCVHAELTFEEPVAGPVLLGAGRYFGVGLCRPIDRGA